MQERHGRAAPRPHQCQAPEIPGTLPGTPIARKFPVVIRRSLVLAALLAGRAPLRRLAGPARAAPPSSPSPPSATARRAAACSPDRASSANLRRRATAGSRSEPQVRGQSTEQIVVANLLTRAGAAVASIGGSDQRGDRQVQAVPRQADRQRARRRRLRGPDHATRHRQGDPSRCRTRAASSSTAGAQITVIATPGADTGAASSTSPRRSA